MSVVQIRPQAGPQERFLATSADIAIYGGAAGGGKTFGLVMEPLRWVGTPGFAAVMFRRTSPQLTGAGSLWAEARRMYPHCGGRARESPIHDWKFPAGSLVEFTHLQHEKTVFDHQGKQYALICFDELTHFTESQFFYMLSRNRSTCGVRPYMRCTTNPDADSWVRKLIAWWIDKTTGLPIEDRSGVLRYFSRVNNDVVWGSSVAEILLKHPNVKANEVLSLTFISASLDDNPALTKIDPGYRARLMALPFVDRERLLGRNWNVRPSAGLYFRGEWMDIVDSLPRLKSTQRWDRVRAWDRAATQPTPENPDPDWTAGPLFARAPNGEVYIEDVQRMRGSPGQIEDLIKSTAEADGHEVKIALWQDPGSAGVSEVDHLRKMLVGYNVAVTKASRDKVTYAGPLSSYADPRAAGGGHVHLVRGSWNDAFVAEAVAFPEGKHDDQIDAASLAFLHLSGPISYDFHPVNVGERTLGDGWEDTW